MSNKKYLKIEEKILKSLGKVSYILIFILIFSLLMSWVDFILYCIVDNYSMLTFLFHGDISFSAWLGLMWKTYHYSYFKIILFALIFLSLAVYRSKNLIKEFSK